MQKRAYCGIVLLLFKAENTYICPVDFFKKYINIHFKSKSMFFERACCLNNDISVHKTDLISVNEIDLKPFRQASPEPTTGFIYLHNTKYQPLK
ncbi:MAG: hypothetical protein PHT87_08275 [Bacteroidales bacterium]|nr:hypothetical protein [Bacteroidales bacterium]MDD4640012.1 hypothetical protein [Bacteroidales bacterium]